MNTATAPPAAHSGFFGRGPKSPEQKARCRAWKRLNRKYRHELKGTGGTLVNGVHWRFKVPRPGQDRGRDCLTLEFRDPRAKGIKAKGSYMICLTEHDIEKWYHDQLDEFARVLGLRQLEPADRGDPDGFFVKWQRAKS